MQNQISQTILINSHDNCKNRCITSRAFVSFSTCNVCDLIFIQENEKYLKSLHSICIGIRYNANYRTIDTRWMKAFSHVFFSFLFYLIWSIISAYKTSMLFMCIGYRLSFRVNILYVICMYVYACYSHQISAITSNLNA